MLPKALFLLPLLLEYGSCIIPNHFHFSDKLRNFESDLDISVTTGYFSQYLDPFSRNSSETFEQRFLYSEEFSLNKKTVFLYVSGPDDFNSVLFKNGKSSFVKAAKQLGATVFALEHRFYGKSGQILSLTNTSNLQYLNSNRAVQDIIFFIEYANEEYKFDSDVRWILWGTGYGGLVATEARKWDPVTVSGVIASSSPLKRQLDFWKYNDVLEQAILKVRGSACHENIKEGFKRIQIMMNTVQGRAQLSDLFELSPPLNSRNLTSNEMQMFYLALIAPFQQIVQFNNRFNLSIDNMCDVMHQSWDFVQSIHQVYVYLSTQLTGSYQPLKFSYEEYVNNLKNPGLGSEFATQRLCQYQMCTEFGWFYTTNNHEDTLFGAVVPTSLFINQCFDIFPELYDKPTATKIQEDIGNSQKFSGKVSGTSMVFINGQYDPWSSLGNVPSDEFSIVSYIIKYGSHANDLNPTKLGFEEISQAHGIIIESIREWVNKPKNTLTFVDTVHPWERPPMHQGEVQMKKISRKQNADRFSEFTPTEKTEEGLFSKVQNLFFGMRPNPELIDFNLREGFEIGTFRQQVDHFDNKNTRFFQQKYIKYARFAKPGGPNLLSIGGEGPMGNGINYLQETKEIVRRAKKYGGTIYVLEHRFYGDSTVENNKDLTKLSSLQMIYDLAEFINSVNLKTNTSNPWITLGGSYPGMLSAWMRQIFPDLVAGAIASSAPVLAKNDFLEYYIVVENALLSYNPMCYEAVRNGFEEIHQLLLTKDGRQELSDVFQLDPPFGDFVSEIDKHYFVFNILDPFADSVQYSASQDGYSFSSRSMIASLCEKVLDPSKPTVKNIGKLVTERRSKAFGSLNNNYTFAIEYLKTDGKKQVESMTMYLWLWQSCSEFGFFQTLDAGKSVFGTGNPLSLQIQMCMDLFGKEYDREKIEDLVEQTNYRYGGRNEFTGTNVVFTNGDVDPWHALGLYETRDPSVVSYLIGGVSHCVDFREAQSTDSVGLKYARKLIDQHIEMWIGLRNNTSLEEDDYEEELEIMETTTVMKSKVSKIALATVVFSVIMCSVVASIGAFVV